MKPSKILDALPAGSRDLCRISLRDKSTFPRVTSMHHGPSKLLSTDSHRCSTRFPVRRSGNEGRPSGDYWLLVRIALAEVPEHMPELLLCAPK